MSVTHPFDSKTIYFNIKGFLDVNLDSYNSLDFIELYTAAFKKFQV